MSLPKPMPRRALSPQAAKRSRPQLRAAVEAMEMRLVLSTFVVNTFVDQTDPPTSTTISLRDAIALAAKHAGADTINVPVGTYPLAQGELLISDTSGAVTIKAVGGIATIDAQGNSRVLEVATGTMVSASGIGITGGDVNDVSPGGGGILNAGTLTLSDGTVSNNSTESSGFPPIDGAGIYNSDTLALSNVTVSDNTSENAGGGIANIGTMKITASTVSGNSADDDGGGIYNAGVATVVGVSVFNNTTHFEFGGGIANVNNGMLTVINSTLSGNTFDFAGGLYNAGKATVADSTIDGNSSRGIYSVGPLTIANSIIAENNIDMGVPASDVSGVVASHGGNFVGQIDGSSGWVGSDRTGTSADPIHPRLTPLGSYGGLTQTYVPLAGSPVLGGGVVGAVPKGTTTDQRGFARIVKGKVDIGAVEVQAEPLIHIKGPPSQTVHAGKTLNVDPGSFTDPAGNGPFLVDVTWGDGTPDTVFSQTTAGAITIQSHYFIKGGNVVGHVAITDAEGDPSNLSPFSVSVVVETPVNVVVDTVKDQIDPAGSKTVSLRDAIAQSGGQVTITFDPKVFAAHRTIVLAEAELELADTFGPVNIIGPAAGVTITRNGNQAIFLIDAQVTANLSGLTIDGGSDANDGPGIQNNGNLTITNSIIRANFTGIDNSSDLLLRDSTISGNSSGGNGAGLLNTGAATILNSTFSGNSSYGGYHDPDPTNGGAIANSGKLTLTNSTLSGNSASDGGGLYNSGTAAVNDCTITANDGYSGGGIYNTPAGKLTVANSIVASNTLPANVPPANGADAFGKIISVGHNLVGQTDGGAGWIGSDLKGTAAHPRDPRLSALGIYGGTTTTQPPLAGSPVIGAGSVALIPSGTTTDQRGFARIVKGKVDIGAVQLQQSGVVTIAPPATQHVVAGVATSINLGSFTNPGGKGPFVVYVNWGDGSPAAIYSANDAGKLGSQTHTFINTGSLNGTIVVVDASGDTSQIAAFSVYSVVASSVTLVVNTSSDQNDSASSKTVSLRDAVNRADAAFGPVSITFDPVVFNTAKTVTLSQIFNQTLEFAHNRFGEISIIAPNAGVSIDGAFTIGTSITVNFDRLTIHGQGITNNGTLEISSSVISGVKSVFGAIYNFGILTLTRSLVSGNTALLASFGRGGPYGGVGGGILNYGITTIFQSSISNNSAPNGGGGISNVAIIGLLTSMTIADSTISGNTTQGTSGGIYNSGYLNITGSTISGNRASYTVPEPGTAGAILSYGVLTLTNSTISGNSADSIGGIYISDGYATIADCTISANTSATGGGGIDEISRAHVTVSNTIVAGNHGGATTPDVAASFINSLGHNLIGKINGSTGWIASDLTGSIRHPLDAKLSSLGHYGGPTKTMIPLVESPALRAGSVALIPPGVSADQRGLPRVMGGRVDIGAVEVDQGGSF